MTANNFSRTSNTQRENTNAIFTSEKLDKLDELSDMLKDLKINNTEYYVSNSATANYTKVNHARNPKTVTHTSDGKGKVAESSNIILQQKLFSNQTLPVVVPTMDPRIDNRTANIGGASQTLLTPATKEVVADAARGSAWVHRNPRHVIQVVRNGSTPGDTGLVVRSKPDPSPVLIGSTAILPDCGISGSLKFGNKQQSTSPDEVRNAQKLDTVIDRKLPDD